MALDTTIIQSKLEEKFGSEVSSFRMERDILTFDATPSQLLNVIGYMNKDSELNFVFLTDICGVHYPENEKNKQFAAVYLLHNWIENIRVRVKVWLDGENPEIDSVTPIFSSANWMERETYDFYGIVFLGHPNLKRILNVDSMTSFPMRKNHPLEDGGRSDKDDRFFGRTTNNYQA